MTSVQELTYHSCGTSGTRNYIKKQKVGPGHGAMEAKHTLSTQRSFNKHVQQVSTRNNHGGIKLKCDLYKSLLIRGYSKLASDQNKFVGTLFKLIKIQYYILQ